VLRKNLIGIMILKRLPKNQTPDHLCFLRPKFHESLAFREVTRKLKGAPLQVEPSSEA